MKQSFEEFIALVNKSVERDPWVKDRKLEGYCKEILGEAKEAIDAIEKKDYENLREELGDIFYDWAHACKLAEEEGLFTITEVIQEITKKIKRRKPFLFEPKRHLTKEETERIWHEAKAQEKE